MNSISIEDKISSVLRNRNNMIIAIRNSLVNNCGIAVSRIDDLIKKNESNSKIVNSLTKVKELISNLLAEIVLAKTVDDIKKIRTRLNYYITKVRKEAEERNINDDSIILFNESIYNIRDDIKEYIRCIKRRDNIDNIVNKYHQNLTKEEKKEINYELAKERRFNKRLNDKYNENKNQYEITKDVKKIALDNDDSKEDLDYETLEDINLEKENITIDNDSKEDFDYESLEEAKSLKENEITIDFNNLEEDLDYELLKDNNDEKEQEVIKTEEIASIIPPAFSLERLYVNSSMIIESKRYIMTPVKKYDGSTIKNVITLLRNIPAYRHNKRNIDLMKRDYANFGKTRSLREFIELSEYNNSIKKALEDIVKNSKLGKKFYKEKDSNYKAEMDFLLELLDEYYYHENNGKVESDFSYDSIKIAKKEKKIKLIEGNIEFMPLSSKRLSLR